MFFGIEQQFDNDECLIYGPDKQWLLDHPDTPNWTRRQWFDEINAIGGCIVLAHPFRVRDYVKKITLNNCVHAVEAFNINNRPEADVYGLAYAKHFGYPVTAGTDMHKAPGPRGLSGVEFDEPWEDISTYVRAIKDKKPFGVLVQEGRGTGEILPLEREYVFLDQMGQPVPWDVKEIFK